MPEPEQLAGTLGNWLGGGARVAAGTLVAAEGSAPLPVGTTMLVREDGAVEGSVSGGCVEGAVVETALGVLAGGDPASQAFGYTDAVAGAVGLPCGGTVHVFVREVGDEARATWTWLAERAAAHEATGLATVLDGRGAGTLLAVAGDEERGSTGVALLDRHVRADLRAGLATGKDRIARYGEDGTRADDALRVHLHPQLPPARLLVFGANDFSAALAPLARTLGFAVTIADARAPFLEAPRYRLAARTVAGWPREVIEAERPGPRDAVVVLSHDPKFDEPAIEAALRTEVGYLGALGSRRTTAAREARLLEAGVPREALARLHAPCGLDLGAGTPEETAVAILAELLAERAGRDARPLREGRGAIRP